VLSIDCVGAFIPSSMPFPDWHKATGVADDDHAVGCQRRSTISPHR